MNKYLILILTILFLSSQGNCLALYNLYPDYKVDVNAYEENYPIDRREFTRFNNINLATNIIAQDCNGNNIDIIDFSRGGIAIKKNNTFETGKTYSIKINYKNTTIPVDFEVLSIENNRIGTKFINLDTEKQNKLLYISARIELDNDLLKTKLSS